MRPFVITLNILVITKYCATAAHLMRLLDREFQCNSADAPKHMTRLKNTVFNDFARKPQSAFNIGNLHEKFR